MTYDAIAPHLRQIDSALVHALCERALALRPFAAGYERALVAEIKAFRLTRTPWDATRVANYLAHFCKDRPEAMALVKALDDVAHERAGLVPTNRHSSRLLGQSAA